MISPLVSADWLEDHLHDPTIRILEVSSDLDPERHREGHIPGALWANWKALCWHATDREFATADEIADRLGQLGVEEPSTLVLYGDPVQYGTYAFWALTMAGVANLRLLDGTITRWHAEGRPISTTMAPGERVERRAGLEDRTSRIGRNAVKDGLANPGRLLLDVRSPQEYSGERVMPPPDFDHGAERKGRIPGAVHLYYRNLLNDDDTFKSAHELEAQFASVGAVPAQAGEIVGYCRLSHRATLAWFAMTHILGWPGMRIYDGSWTEWGSIVGYPVER